MKSKQTIQLCSVSFSHLSSFESTILLHIYIFVWFRLLPSPIWQREKNRGHMPLSRTRTHICYIPIIRTSSSWSPPLTKTWCTGSISTRSLSAARTLTLSKCSSNMSFSFSSPWPLTASSWNKLGREDKQGRGEWGGEGRAGGGGEERGAPSIREQLQANASYRMRARAPQLAHARS